MTTFRTLAILFLLPNVLHAQTIRQHALDLDGINDEVNVANASALISSSTALSLTCWVQPTNQFTGYPDFDGFAGFRNEFSADFYLLQISGTSLEGRIRPSGGTAYTVTAQNQLMLNAWQFLSLTYDSDSLRMYVDGAQVDAVPATGLISSSIETFRIGNLPFNAENFRLDGQVDEVALWSRSLTQAEILCIKDNGAWTTDPDLKLYYKCDQGTVGGVNTTITGLTDASGHLNGVISNLALNGTSSNFVMGAPIPGTAVATLCQGESYSFNGQVLSAAGTYSAFFPTGGACDSMATLSLGVQVVNVNVVQNGPNLSAQAANAQYQWLDCNNGFQQIPNATSPLYAVTASGSYAVEVTQNGCADTSSCYAVIITGLEEALSSVPMRVIAADGAGQFWLELEKEVTGEFRVLDVRGRNVFQGRSTGRRTLLDLGQAPSGVYVVDLRTGNDRSIARFVR